MLDLDDTLIMMDVLESFRDRADRPRVERLVERLHRALEPGTFTVAWSASAAFSLEEAIDKVATEYEDL